MKIKTPITTNTKRRRIMWTAAALLLITLSMNASAVIAIAFDLALGFASALVSFAGEMIVRMSHAGLLYKVFYDRLAKDIDHLPEAVLMNPQIMTENHGEYIVSPAINDIVNLFIALIVPFYVLAIMLIGFYLLFVSASPLGRARAKSTLIKLVVSIAVIILTIPIIQLFMDISEYLTGYIFGLTDTTPALISLKGGLWGIYNNFLSTMVFSYWNAIYLFMFTGVMFALIFILIGIRFFLVVFFTALFPVTVFFFAFYFTRRVGEQMFKETLAWIFMQPLMALILVAISVASAAIPLGEDETVITCFGFAGAMIFIILPLISAHIMDWMAMLMIMLTGVEFPGMHGLIGIVDELQIEGPEVEEITPPPPIRPH